MGKLEQGPLHVVTDQAAVPVTGRTVFCPCLENLPPEIACMLGILPIHDANGRLVEELSKPRFRRVPDFAGICLADPFRRLDDILDCVRGAGIKGIVNLPTVAPLLGQPTNPMIAALHDAEQEALIRARKMGFEYLFITTQSKAQGDRNSITLDRLIVGGG